MVSQYVRLVDSSPTSDSYSHEPLIPRIDAVTQQLPHKVDESLLPSALLRHLKLQNLFKLLRCVILYERGPGSAARNSETMARMLGC
jgi:hypothetical protein